MMVLTKYCGPTDHKGARVQVTLGSGRKVYVAWDHALDGDENHAEAAAHAIAKHCGLRGVFVMASMPDPTPYAYAVSLVEARKGRRITIKRSHGAVVCVGFVTGSLPSAVHGWQRELVAP